MISPLMRPARGVLGRATKERTAEGRSELAELADDSASSADVTIPSSPRGASRSMTERRLFLYASSGEGVEHGTRDARLSQGLTSSHSQRH